ncbi:MAG: Uma2 family endonuclease [Firmicutes bacterium]|nr:Uma2 family endonuclease [Bacillota bacterium]
MSPRPAVNHNVVAYNIVTVFKIFLKGKTCSAFGEVDVFLTDKDRVIPDVVVVCDRNKIKTNGIHGAPDLVAEVLSPKTQKNDRGYKKNLYEKCGVKEYWIVDAEHRSVEVNLLKDGVFYLDEIYAIYPDYVIEGMTEEERSRVPAGFVTSLFPDLTISLEDVFEGRF